MGTDASPVGLGAVMLTQTNKHGQSKVVSYASHLYLHLPTTPQPNLKICIRYQFRDQTFPHVCVLLWPSPHTVTVITNHKPLIPRFNKPPTGKSISTHTKLASKISTI